MMRLATLIGFLLVTSASAEDWPGWRGPRGDGTSEEKNIPLEWSSTKNVLWKAPIPGTGHSSPIVFGDRVFVTSCLEKAEAGKDLPSDRLLVALDRKSGKVLWERTVVTSKLEKKHRDNSFASGTPATDGTHLYVAFLDAPNMVAVCYDMDGKEIWRQIPGTLKSVHGFCTSPVLHKNLVILNGDQDDKSAFLVALDKTTGKEIWRAPRNNHTRSYCTPILIKTAKEPNLTQLVLSGDKTVTGYNADTGELLWIHKGPTEQYVASLVYHEDILCLTTGFPDRHLMGISPHGRGDITKTDNIVWHIAPPKTGTLKNNNASYVPSPIAAEGLFYIVSDFGLLSCVDAKSGKRLFMEQLGKHHYHSPIRVGGHVIFLDDDGVAYVIKPGPKFDLVRKNVLGEECHGSPAVAHGAMFLRGLHNLYCIGETK